MALTRLYHALCFRTPPQGIFDMRGTLRDEPFIKPLGSRPSVDERAEMERKTKAL